MEREGVLWSQVEGKAVRVYRPILEAFIREIKAQVAEHKEVPPRLVRYLLGRFDFYKVVAEDARRQTVVQAFNLGGLLNRSSPMVRPSRRVPRVSLPTRLVSIDFRRGSDTTVELFLDRGWQFSFRLHNARLRVEPSLKFDIQIVGHPSTIGSFYCQWD